MLQPLLPTLMASVWIWHYPLKLQGAITVASLLITAFESSCSFWHLGIFLTFTFNHVFRKPTNEPSFFPSNILPSIYICLEWGQWMSLVSSQITSVRRWVSSSLSLEYLFSSEVKSSPQPIVASNYRKLKERKRATVKHGALECVITIADPLCARHFLSTLAILRRVISTIALWCYHPFYR